MSEQEQCPKCGAAVGLGRLRWDNDPFVEIRWDEEPFVADAHVELDDTSAQVELSVVACVSCGHITDVFNESGLQQTLTTLRAANERLEKEIAELRAALTQADDGLDRQRSAFLRWRDLVLAVTTAADVQTCPPAAHAMRSMDAWRDGLSKNELEALSAAMEVAANARHGGETTTPEDEQ